jgi:PAS domain S-box-containing protein
VEQAVVATDPQARILYWNQGAERLYGWSADEVLGRNAAEVIVASGGLPTSKPPVRRNCPASAAIAV